MRSDGRCGRDFISESHGETKCAVGECCSSHGWCGAGEEYCSVSLGCQSGCSKPDEGASAKIDHGEGGETGDEYDSHPTRQHNDDDDYYRHAHR